MFISPAFASDSAAAAAEPGLLTSLMPLLLVFLIFYFMIIRPQNKRMAEHRRMIDTLKQGDKVVTAGGIVATVRKLLDDDKVEIELAEGVRVIAVRSTLMSSLSPRPANDSKAQKDKKKG